MVYLIDHFSFIAFNNLIQFELTHEWKIDNLCFNFFDCMTCFFKRKKNMTKLKTTSNWKI